MERFTLCKTFTHETLKHLIIGLDRITENLTYNLSTKIHQPHPQGGAGTD